MEETTGRIVIGEADRQHLGRAARWARFIAIVSFIFIGIGALCAVAMLSVSGMAAGALSGVGDLPFQGMASGLIIGYSLFFIVVLVVALFLTIYLYRFATRTLRAIGQGNDAVMTEALENLGKYFRLSGWLLIIYLGLLALMLILLPIFAFAMGEI
jgi:hypothetical protein